MKVELIENKYIATERRTCVAKSVAARRAGIIDGGEYDFTTVYDLDWRVQSESYSLPKAEAA